jgi:UDP-3-O-[3-hydroxymyristoyl] glucosamine N-acyltransferase
MYQLKHFEYKASEISSILGKMLLGEDMNVNNVQQLDQVIDNSMSLCYPKFKNILSGINSRCLIFCSEDTKVKNSKITYLITDNPKLAFFKFISDYLVTDTTYWLSKTISESSEDYPGVYFGYNVRIGKNTIIAPNVKIGSNCIISNNVVIRTNVEIGSNSVIKDNSIIGSEGFGFMNSDEGLIHIPQIGGIKIGNDVVIGSNCAIEKPALGYTIIQDNVKIDDLVQIGHNQNIGRNTIITTGFKAEGGVKIGANSFIGMGVTIISKELTIGNNCLVGAGTVLTKSVPDNTVVYAKQELVFDDVRDRLTNILTTKKQK